MMCFLRPHNKCLERTPYFYQIHPFPVHFHKWGKKHLGENLKSEKITLRENQPTFYLCCTPVLTPFPAVFQFKKH